MFPDTTYGLDSGGKPENLELTYDQFREFHRLYYHPGNGRFFFWGDVTRKKGVWSCWAASWPIFRAWRSIPPCLSSPVCRACGLWKCPMRPTRTTKAWGMVTVNWLLPETTDPVLNFSLQMLDHILVGLPGSLCVAP